MGRVKDRRPIAEGPRIIFCREAQPVEVAAYVKAFNADHQCFGPFEFQPFDNAEIVVHREGEEPAHFKCYEVAVKKDGQAAVIRYVYARDYGNFVRFCEKVLGIDVVGKVDDGN